MLDTPDTVKLANRRKLFLIFMASAIMLALIFMILAIRDQTERAKADQEAAQTAAAQASVPETPEEQKAAEQYALENGEYIDYSDFYAKAESTGLPVGKRYRFRAFVDEGTRGIIFLHNPNYPQGPQKQMQGTEAFDTEAEHENFLKSNDTDSRTIVASMGEDGTILIYKVD